MHLVLCSSSDPGALWAFRELRALGLTPLELVTTEMLALSTRWEHRLGEQGVTTSFDLPDGRRVASTDVRGVLNRLLGPPEALVAQAVPSDREYVRQELTALYLSWLHGINGPVVNRPTPQGLAGRWRHAAEWAQAAYRAGLQIDSYSQAGDESPEKGYASFAPPDAKVTSVIVLGGETFGARVPDRVAESCRRLALEAATSMLGIDLFSRNGAWMFAGATPFPDLQAGGAALVHRLKRILESGAEP